MTHDHSHDHQHDASRGAQRGSQHGKPVDCDSALDKLFDFLDGELDDDFEAKLRAHVDKCGHCFEVADFERRFLAALQQARGEEKCPKSLRDRIMSTLRAEGLEA